MELFVSALIALLASSIFGSLILIYANRRKTSAEEQNIVGDTYGDMLDHLNEQMKSLRVDYSDLREENMALKNRIGILEEQVSELTQALKAQRGVARVLLDGIAKLTKQIFALDHTPVWEVPDNIR